MSSQQQTLTQQRLRVEGRGNLDEREGRFELYVGEHYLGSLDVGKSHPKIGWCFYWNNSRESLQDLLGRFEEATKLLGTPIDLSDDDDLSGLTYKLWNSDIWHGFHFSEKEPKLATGTYLPRSEGISEEIKAHLHTLNDNPDPNVREFDFGYWARQRRDFRYAGSTDWNTLFEMRFEGRKYSGKSLAGRGGWFSFLKSTEHHLPTPELLEWIIDNHEQSELFRNLDTQEATRQILDSIEKTLNPGPITHLLVRDRHLDPGNSFYMGDWAGDYSSCTSLDDAREALRRRERSGQKLHLAEIIAQQGESHELEQPTSSDESPNTIYQGNGVTTDFVLIQDVHRYDSSLGCHLSQCIVESFENEDALMKAYTSRKVPFGWDNQDAMYAVRIVE